jgi:hypothetical protein
LAISAAIAVAAVACGSADEPSEKGLPGAGAAPPNDDDTNLDGASSTTASASGATSTTATSSSSGQQPLPCPYEGPPVVEPASLPACPTTVCGGGAHCVPTSLLTPDQASSLADCDAQSKCVPDPFIATMGNYIPPACTTVFGSEGRCLSRCIPEVAAQAAALEGAPGCGPSEVCAPCYDPFDQMPTAACTQSCDPGPKEPAPPALPGCCDGKATCVPKAAIPDAQEDKLDDDSCDEDGDNGPASLCVPNELLDPAWKPTVKCETSWLIQTFKGKEYKEGGCLPGCLGAVQQIGIKQGDCPDGFKCAPCKDPNNGGAPTGACPWMP